MSAAFVTDLLESSAGILFDDVMLRVVEEADNELFLTAMSFFSLALDRSPETLVSDEQHRQFVVTYIQRGLLPYAEKAATLQVGLLSIAGARTPQDVFPAFLVELKKVSRVVIPHEELATRLLNDPRRSWYYFLAVVCAAGITCRRDPKLGASFGLKRSFLGQWRKLH